MKRQWYKGKPEDSWTVVHVCQGQDLPRNMNPNSPHYGQLKPGYAPCKCLMLREKFLERKKEAHAAGFMGSTRKSGGVSVTNYAMPITGKPGQRMDKRGSYTGRSVFHKWGGVAGPKPNEGLGATIAKSFRDAKFGRGKRKRTHSQTTFDKGLEAKQEVLVGRQALEQKRAGSLNVDKMHSRKAPDLEMKATLVKCESRREAQRKWAKAFLKKE